MSLRVISQLENKVGEKTYRFLCDCDSPIVHIKESLSQFIELVDKIEKKVLAEQEALATQGSASEQKPQE